ncbi:U3 small nucleolar rna associated protein 6 [Fasciola gigantica]|uniref:U3 small nucleolar rna associated protein 6 n=1 Tax=Fasciola gigantica TaxID=46835 RepID=A0A504YL51_FASGI|nr:U3 small nucleolar rna associated protein 6 [Fasciola gigantica]
MAEVVERNLEDSLDEIIFIKKAKLFKKHEINELIRKRRQHEYSLQKRNKRVLDYDSYITTEMTILKLLRIRRQEVEDRRYLDKIERSILTRLVRLHRQLCYRFQSRIDLWMRFIKFSLTIGRHMSVVRLWNRVLQVHGRTDPRLWAAAASYHLHRNTRANIQSSSRNVSSEISQLSDKEKKIRTELNALNRYLKKKDQSRIESLLEEQRQTCVQLKKAKESLARQHRITTDRVYLNALRESRRLLTQGIALNPECDMLHLELLKLEADAADFFKSRILPRVNIPIVGTTKVDVSTNGDKLVTEETTQTVEKDDVNIPAVEETKMDVGDSGNKSTIEGTAKTVEKDDSNTPTIEETKINIDDNDDKSTTEDTTQKVEKDYVQPIVNTSRLKKRKKSVPEKVRKDNRMLLAEVTEDTPFLASGGAFNLVFRSLLDRWSSNPAMLQAVNEVTSKVSHFIDEDNRKLLQEKLANAATEDTKDTNSDKQEAQVESQDPSVKLRDQMSQLCQAMMNDSPVEAINLWNSWYLAPGTGGNLFRTVDPTLPDAVGLFHMRMSITTIQANWSFQSDTTSNHVANLSKQEIIRQTRSWLDSLATSRWGEQCPEFWIQYLSFERDCGDCARLPAVHWRASKLLNEKAYRRFTQLLNATDTHTPSNFVC